MRKLDTKKLMTQVMQFLSDEARNKFMETNSAACTLILTHLIINY